MQAVIMAGGKGTRLRSLTKDEIPKPLTPVAGKPILQWQIEQLRAQNITDIILIIGHLGDKIRAFFGDGKAFGVHISYIEEPEPLGTAGALSLLPPLLAGDVFFLIFGDVLFAVDLARMERFHRERNALATMFVHPNAHPFDSDLVICDENGRVLQFDSKNNQRDYWYHNCVNAGFYLLDRDVCKQVPEPKKTDLEKQVLNALLAKGEAVYGYASSEYIKDVGTVERIQAAEEDINDDIPAKRCLNRKQKAIFIDRDGTVNRKNGLVSEEAQLTLEENAAEAIRRINGSGYLAIIVTNQPVVARGLCSVEEVERLHMKMETLLGREGAYLDAVYFCPHHPDKGYPEENPAYKIPCHCRKPDIGMLEKCAVRFNLDLPNCWMVGDTTVDLQTGRNAGTHTALVLTGDAGKDGKYAADAELTCRDLLDAVEQILEWSKMHG
ncbi:MAG: HAD-IIIA family hydrolase [Clostridiaceae bacterium]|nr:HAD-IIIA family hydrolase [Clostridiaceae bacterium]